MLKISDVLKEVYLERLKQNEKWGEQNHPNGTGELKFRVLAEIRRQDCDAAHKKGIGTWTDILREEVYEALAESNPIKLREELIQCAAVCVSWIEAIDRKKNG